MVLSVVLAVLTFATVALVAGNNLSACVGPAIGSRIVSKRFGILLGAAGFALGLLLQGSTMVHTLNVLMPQPTQTLRAAALVVCIVVFAVAALIRAPMSINMSLVAFLAGLNAIQSGTGAYTLQVVLMWVAAPLIAIVFAFTFMRVLNRRWPGSFWRRLQAYKIFIIAFSFTTAYVLGSNTLGLIVATGGFDWLNVASAVVAVFVGCFFLAGGTLRRLTQEFYLMRYSNATATLITSTVLVEAATLLRIPLSNTQTTSSAVLGAGLSYKAKFMSLKPFLLIVAGWVAAPLLSFTVGFLTGNFA